MSKLSFLLFVALFGLIFANPLLRLNESKLSPRIVGGHTAAKRQFPYLVSLQNSRFHVCGASILNENWILTAAHCAPLLGQNTDIVVGAFDLSTCETSTVKHTIRKVIEHPEFNADGQFHNDLALIKINEKIIFTKNVQPIKLPPIDLNVDSIPVTASGWGRLQYQGPSPSRLKYLESKVLSHEACVKRLSEIPTSPPVIETQICTFTKSGEGLCHGDSGGPIVVGNYQVGIVSRGQPCAIGYPDINTHVYKFLDWINKTMEEN